MKKCYRIILGKGHQYASKCFAEGLVGVDFDFDFDLSSRLTEKWREFNQEFIPYWLGKNPTKTRIAAGLACGMTHTLSKGMETGSIVICPDGSGAYRVGEVVGSYRYSEGHALPHQRPVQWKDGSISRSDMSERLRRSSGNQITIVNISDYLDEIETLLNRKFVPGIQVDEEIKSVSSAFALEKHLEDFLVKNWSRIELGEHYEIFSDEEGLVGKQYPTDTGPMDILAISKDKKSLLVIELKKGRASDEAVGQILRYMGYIKEEILEDGQNVRGMIIALDEDKRLQRAISMVPEIDFYRYEVTFSLARA